MFPGVSIKWLPQYAMAINRRKAAVPDAAAEPVYGQGGPVRWLYIAPLFAADDMQGWHG